MSFFHTIWGPLGSFLCILYWGLQITSDLRLLYGAPQISFFSYNMGAPLRSVSLFTIWAPPPHQISFFACYRGAISHLVFFSQNIWGSPQISFSAYYMGPLRLVSLLTIWGPLRSVSVHTFWGLLSDQFFLLLYGAPSDQFLRILYGGPLRSLTFFAYYMGVP